MGLPLFLFVLNLNHQAVAVERYPLLRAGYEDGFYIKTDNNRYLLKLGTRLNTVYSYATGSSFDDYSSFDQIHAKLYAGGNALGRTFQYYIQAAAGSQNRSYSLFPDESPSSNFILEDYYIRFRHKGLDLKIGQYKVPFSKQWITYSGNLNLLHRSLVVQNFQLGRERGLSLQRIKDRYSTSISIFNGAGPFQIATAGQPVTNTGQNMSNGSPGGKLGHMYVSRLAIHPKGSVGYSEGSIENFQTLRWELGAAFVYDHHRGLDITADGTIDDPDANFMHGQLDLHIKYRGISLQGEYLYRNTDRSGAANFRSQGFYVQPSFFLWPQQSECVLRFGYYDPRSGLSSDRSQEMGVGINWYFYPDHRFKWSVNYTRLRQQTPGDTQKAHFIDTGIQVTL